MTSSSVVLVPAPAPRRLDTGRVSVEGTFTRPRLVVRIGPNTPYPPDPSRTMKEWVKTLGRPRWEAGRQAWIVDGLGTFTPSALLAQVGLDVDWAGRSPDLRGTSTLDDLAAPIARADRDGRTVMVRPRLAGYDLCLQLCGPGAVWDSDRGLFRVHAGDILDHGQVRPGVWWPPDAVTLARRLHAAVPVPPAVAPVAARLAQATDLSGFTPADTARIGRLPAPVPGRELFPYQKAGVLALAAGRRCLFDEPGVGKAQPLSEPVLTPHGWTPIGDLAVGDQVIGADGHPTRVTGVFDRGVMPVYRVAFSDGAYTRVSADHLWRVMDRRHRRRTAGPWRTLTTRELAAEGLTLYGSRRFQIPMMRPAVFPERDLPMDPYAVGALLGDGAVSSRYNPRIVTDDEIADALVLPDGGRVSSRRRKTAVVSASYLAGCAATLRSIGVMEHRAETKTVPREYLFASAGQRLALLQGLLDTDGSPAGGQRDGVNASVEYGTVSRQLAQDVLFLCQSLGGTASISQKYPTYMYRGQRRTGQLYYRMIVRLPSPLVPFRLGRKLRRWRPRTKYEPSRAITAIEPDGADPVRCIRVAAADHLYVTRGCVVTHNTVQAATAARMLGASRTLVVCPPLLTTNWAREAALAGLAQAERDVVVFRPGRKEPALPDSGVVVVADSLLAARPDTAARVRAWRCDVMIVDEAHRLKTIGSRRSEAVLNVAVTARHAPLVLTGTPILSSPHELVPLLELARVLCPVFGGRARFLQDFCLQDRFGGWHARKRALPALHDRLAGHVWVRRRKRDVLPQLPLKRRTDLVVDVPLSDYRATHKDVIARVQAWVTWWRAGHDGQAPTQADQDRYAKRSGFELVSLLRRAAGLTKVKTAADVALDHLNQTGCDRLPDGRVVWRRPLIVWGHHLDVLGGITARLSEHVGPVEHITGDTGDRERDDIVDRFQQGLIPVLVGGITKAGVGLTLTRSSDAIFAETDWTPALISQAEDRTHRVGQDNPCLYTTLIARGTLDEPIQRVLNRKTRVLEDGLGQTGDSVAVLADEDAAGLAEIVAMVVAEALRHTHA